MIYNACTAIEAIRSLSRFGVNVSDEVISEENKNYYFNIYYKNKKISDSYQEDYIKGNTYFKYLEKQLQKGIRVLITNPALVETGLDLNSFTTLIFYNIAYNLYIFRQASRRSWRINQTAPRVEVYMFYYKNTMQQRALRLMASKLSFKDISNLFIIIGS